MSGPPASAVPPARKMSPLEAALDATPRAVTWATAAHAHLMVLRSGLRPLFGKPLPPEAFAVANTHFHLDRDPGNLDANLHKLIVVFDRILQMLRKPRKFYREGPMVKLGGVESWWADAPVGGFHRTDEQNAFTFRPKYPDTGPNCRSAILLHEGAHFCGQAGEIIHFAYEFPTLDGTPHDGGPRNYKNLLTAEAMRNASSYAAFAIHVAAGTDERFGLHRPNL
jgi:hypothetical protein